MALPIYNWNFELQSFVGGVSNYGLHLFFELRLEEPSKVLPSDSFCWSMQYVILDIFESCDPVNKLYYCDLSVLPHGLDELRRRNDMLPFVKLVDTFEASYSVVSNDDSQFTFLTNKDAPRYKLVRVDLREPEIWTDVIQEDEKDVLESAYAVNGNQLLVCYLSDVKYVVQIRDLETGMFLYNLPLDIGTVSGISGKREDSEVFLGFTSFLTPGIIYRCNLATEVPEMKIFREIVVSGFDRTEFQVNQVTFLLIICFVTLKIYYYFSRFLTDAVDESLCSQILCVDIIINISKCLSFFV